jgi:hypothetical protein
MNRSLHDEARGFMVNDRCLALCWTFDLGDIQEL